jgi:hypothetical protein
VTHELRWTPRVLSALAALLASLFTSALARAFGASATRATIAGLAALFLPWTVFTAWAPAVSEMQCVAWMMASLWCLARHREAELTTGHASLAGLCATMACGHRYEAWFATAGIAVVLLARAPRRPAIAFALASSIVPVAWLAINAHRSGEPLDFVHRVIRYRAAIEPNRSAARDVTRLVAAVFATAGVAVTSAFAASSRFVRERDSSNAAVAREAVLGAALAVIAGNLVIECRGGGATHHALRTWLLPMWFAMPLAVCAVRGKRAFAALSTLLFVQDALGMRALPRDVDRATVEAGRALRALGTPGECYALEAGRLDFLWIEAESTRPDDARADRPFGASTAEESRWLALASQCRVAVTHSRERATWLARRGFHARVVHGAWTISERALGE